MAFKGFWHALDGIGMLRWPQEQAGALMGGLLQVSSLCTCSVTGGKRLNAEAGLMESGGIWVTKTCSLRGVSVGKFHLGAETRKEAKEEP